MINFILLVGFILRLLAGFHKDFWFDEVISYLIAKQNFSNLIILAAADNQPPLYFVILHFWQQINQSAIFLRFPSLIFGIISIILSYHVAKELVPPKTAKLTALIFSLSPLQIYFSQEVRMYSLWMMLFLASLYYFLRFLKASKHSSLSFIIYHLSFLFLSFLTHWATFIFILSLILYLYLINKKLLKSYLINLIIMFIFLLPFIYFFVTTPRDPSYSLNPIIGIPTTLISFVIGGISQITLKTYFSSPVPLIIKFLFAFTTILVLLFSFIGFQKASLKLKIFILCFLLLPILSLSLIHWITPIYYVRLLIPSSFGIYLLTSLFLEKINSRLVTFLVISCLLSVSLIQNFYPPFKSQTLSLAVKLISKNNQNQPLIFHQNTLSFYPFLYYLPNAQNLMVGTNLLSNVTIKTLGGETFNQDKFLSNIQPFYLLTYSWDNRNEQLNKLRKNLEANFFTPKQLVVNDLIIYHYQPKNGY